MKSALALAVLLAVALPARAADTPDVAPAAAAPTVQERLAKARQAVQARDWAAAIRELDRAAREEPRNADVHNLLGYSYRNRAAPDLRKAFEHYRTALKFDPRHKGAHEYIGEAYLLERRLADAERHLLELEKICGGRTCEEYQDLEKAIVQFKARN